jgi:glycosyltransferase involved in cell wall biosynthesis
METMVSGTPLIAINCVELRETVEDTPARVVHPRNASELATTMELQLRNPSKSESEAFVATACVRFDARTSFALLRELDDAMPS